MALPLALLLGGCGATAGESGAQTAPEPTAAGAEGTPEPDAAQPEPDAAPDALAGTLSATDLGWLQLMIPINDRTLLLLELVENSARDPGFAAFAAELADTHRAELPELHAPLTDAGVEYRNPHEHHDMTGMPTDEELREVAEAGAAFDATAYAHLHEHLEQAAMISASAAEAGSDPETTRLAADLAQVREEQREALEEVEPAERE